MTKNSHKMSIENLQASRLYLEHVNMTSQLLSQWVFLMQELFKNLTMTVESSPKSQI